MGFNKKIKYYLVHTLKTTNKEAATLINSGSVKINGEVTFTNCVITDYSEIKVNNAITREKTDFIYLLFNKSVGFESTLNKKIENNISVFFEGFKNLAIAGRLDKQSEGLLILSNDGKWVESLCHPKFEKEKEYIVTLDKEITDAFIQAFMNGVTIGNYVTKKCFCEKISAFNLKVILTEGKNRQIRKMCKSLKFNVLKLKRIRISTYKLDNLKPSEFKFVKINT
jgi:23S rRNA pseudouridine2604 synthase